MRNVFLIFHLICSSPRFHSGREHKATSGLTLIVILENWLTLSVSLWCLSWNKKALDRRASWHRDMCLKDWQALIVGSLSTKTCWFVEGPSVACKHISKWWKWERLPLECWTKWQTEHMAIAVLYFWLCLCLALSQEACFFLASWGFSHGLLSLLILPCCQCCVTSSSANAEVVLKISSAK